MIFSNSNDGQQVERSANQLRGLKGSEVRLGSAGEVMSRAFNRVVWAEAVVNEAVVNHQKAEAALHTETKLMANGNHRIYVPLDQLPKKPYDPTLETIEAQPVEAPVAELDNVVAFPTSEVPNSEEDDRARRAEAAREAVDLANQKAA